MEEFKSIFNGMNIIVLPDDDEKLKNVKPGCMGSDGVRFYIGETLWLTVKDKLVSMM